MATAMMTMEPQVMAGDGVTLTETAASKLSGIMMEKGMAGTHGLRVFVQGGGCGGMQYGMTFENSARPGDQIYSQHGMTVYVDPTSLFYISGARIDYVDSLMGGGFHIENPQAVSSCGCGSSFRTSHSHTGEEQPESCGYH
jgi:iron-sulfur cluster assembly protein